MNGRTWRLVIHKHLALEKENASVWLWLEIECFNGSSSASEGVVRSAKHCPVLGAYWKVNHVGPPRACWRAGINHGRKNKDADKDDKVSVDIHRELGLDSSIPGELPGPPCGARWLLQSGDGWRAGQGAGRPRDLKYLLLSR